MCSNESSLPLVYMLNLPKGVPCSCTREEYLEKVAKPDVVCDVIMHMVGVVALVLNCIAVIAYRHVTFPQARFLQNLAVADGLLPVVCICQRWLPYFVHIDWCSAYYSCILVFNAFMNGSIAIMSLKCLTGVVGIYAMAVVKPFLYRSLSGKKIFIVILSLWLMPYVYLLCLMIIALTYQIRSNGAEHFCEILSSDSFIKGGKLLWICLVLLLVVLITATYIKVYIVARRSLFWKGHGSLHSRSLRRSTKALKTTVFLLLSLLVSWSAVVLSSGVGSSLALHVNAHSLFFGLFLVWLLMNAASDPIIVILRMRQVKTAYKQLLCCSVARPAD